MTNQSFRYENRLIPCLTNHDVSSKKLKYDLKL